jgi:hypothetical protein
VKAQPVMTTINMDRNCRTKVRDSSSAGVATNTDKSLGDVFCTGEIQSIASKFFEESIHESVDFPSEMRTGIHGKVQRS